MNLLGLPRKACPALEPKRQSPIVAGMEGTIIEELDANELPGPFDAQLEPVLAGARGDAYKFLSATFEFLKRKTAFFGASRLDRAGAGCAARSPGADNLACPLPQSARTPASSLPGC